MARIALLIGNQEFLPSSGLERLEGPANDVERLAKVLADPELGGFQVERLIDQPHGTILETLNRTLQEAKSHDLVFLFYAGHGKLDRSGGLCLATASTSNILLATSVPTVLLHSLIAQSDCRTIILALDCCYSGALGEHFRGASPAAHLSKLADTQGLHLLTATTSTQPATELFHAEGESAMGKFTYAIVRGIETGAADHNGDREITISDLCRHIELTVRGQTPQYWARNVIGDPLISKVIERTSPEERQLIALFRWYEAGAIDGPTYRAIQKLYEPTGNDRHRELIAACLDDPTLTSNELVRTWSRISQKERPETSTKNPVAPRAAIKPEIASVANLTFRKAEEIASLEKRKTKRQLRLQIEIFVLCSLLLAMLAQYLIRSQPSLPAPDLVPFKDATAAYSNEGHSPPPVELPNEDKGVAATSSNGSRSPPPIQAQNEDKDATAASSNEGRSPPPVELPSMVAAAPPREPTVNRSTGDRLTCKSFDSDLDQVDNCTDACPNSQPKEAVDHFGCRLPAHFETVIQENPKPSFEVSIGQSSENVHPKSYLPPPYPADAWKYGLQGTVMLVIQVDEEGVVKDVVVERSSGHRILDEAATAHVLRSWTFYPAISNGIRVRSRVKIPIKFTI
jgi:TonB family protein